MLGSDPPSAPISVERVRALLLGREGPYADPRVAIDALDNLAVLVDGTDVEDRQLLGSTLLALVVDDDPVVATGAAIGCDSLRDELDPFELERTLFAADSRLDRTSIGFSSARSETVRGELALAAASSTRAPRSLVERVVAAASPSQRALLVAEVAARRPALVMWWAREWVGPDDTGVLARLPAAWQRVAVAGAVRPWTLAAVGRIDDIGRWLGWDPLDVAALRRVMSDEAPELTHPDRFDDSGDAGDAGVHALRWWIVAEEPWAWTLWRSEDGHHAIEELSPGWSMLGIARLIDEVAARSWLARVLDPDGPDGPDAARPHR